MRRVVFFTMGLLELAVAGLLVLLGFQLPSSSEIGGNFATANRVTGRAGDQVRLLRRQVRDLRRPELQQLADRLETRTRSFTAALRDQKVDFETMRTMRDALGDVARGLDGFASALDPEGVGRLGDSLGATASFLDQDVVPAAEKAAKHLDESTAALRTDAERLGKLLQEAPVDLKAAREVHDSLARFGQGLEKMDATLKLGRLDTMREGFSGLQNALTIGAEQVERLSGYSYPVVRFQGLRPVVEQRQFWPEGDEIAAGMRKAAGGAAAAGKELEEMAADLPKLRDSLRESRTVVDKTRQALGTALAQRDKVEPLLREVPAHAARLADELPRLGGDLAKILRDTRRLQDVARALRQAQKSIDAAVARWPELRRTLTHAATFLRTAQGQLDQALKHRRDYEAATQQSVVLAESFAALLPLLTDHLSHQLGDEEQALDDLEQSIDEVGTALPAYAATASQVVTTGRLLMWLMAVLIGLHGAYLELTVRMGQQYSI